MYIGAIVAGVLMISAVLWDAFEAIILSKTVRRRFSINSLFYGAIWRVWRLMVKATRGSWRQWVLIAFGPLSLIFLIGFWAVLLVLGFGLIHLGAGTLGDGSGVGDHIYFSGVTFFTLGYGDLAPKNGLGQFLAVFEAGVGFASLAVVISYVPVMYSLFANREHLITLLDSKAGSDPSAGELLKRYAEAGDMESLHVLLRDWEKWSAEQLEGFLSYPILAYYRSQHDDQSWLLSLTCILDACSIISLGFENEEDLVWAKRLKFQAKATFQMARHVIVDLAYILDVPPDERPYTRCSAGGFKSIVAELRRVGLSLRTDSLEFLEERTMLYEPYVVSLARDLYFTLPSWTPAHDAVDNWSTSAWESAKHF